MNTLLKSCNLSRLNHAETGNLNRPITRKETESKLSQQRKAQDQMVAMVNSIKHLLKN